MSAPMGGGMATGANVAGDLAIRAVREHRAPQPGAFGSVDSLEVTADAHEFDGILHRTHTGRENERQVTVVRRNNPGGGVLGK